MPRTRNSTPAITANAAAYGAARSRGRSRPQRSACAGSPEDPVSLCDALDRVLEVGAVAHGDLVITVADVPLIKIALGLLVASVETAEYGRESAKTNASKEEKINQSLCEKVVRYAP